MQCTRCGSMCVTNIEKKIEVRQGGAKKLVKEQWHRCVACKHEWKNQ